jgi:putative membrane protein
MMLLFWTVIVGGIVLLVRYFSSAQGHESSLTPPTAASDFDDPFRILDERFARGEIDEDEYKRRRELLKAR